MDVKDPYPNDYLNIINKLNFNIPKYKDDDITLTDASDNLVFYQIVHR
jgi:hypothetical protein